AHDRAGVFPEADFAALRDKGLMGLMVPPRLGGPGATFADYARVAMRLAVGNGATALIFNMEAAGTSATRRGHPLERIFRDARCGSLQPATSDVCADWLGMAALGRDPENDAVVPRW
ncbi:MAG: acyl-CoA dehydrogenase family protein, partial [Actinomycetota bacterium]|nr:acyl-CoA dehydrogenase family protein [Actinomycetota bacterium]